MTDQLLEKAESIVNDYLESCPDRSKASLRQCLQRLALVIRNKLPYTMREHIQHFILLCLKIMVVLSSIALFITMLLKEDVDDHDPRTVRIEKTKKWTEVILFFGLGLHLLIVFWPDDQGIEKPKLYQRWRQSQFKSVNVITSFERISIFIAGLILIVFGFGALFDRE
jgi:hypothetical protein